MAKAFERFLIIAAFFALFMLMIGTNGRLAKVAKAETSRFAHLDHRITNLRNRMDTTGASAPVDQKNPEAQEEKAVAQPSAFDPSGGLQGFDMPSPMPA